MMQRLESRLWCNGSTQLLFVNFLVGKLFLENSHSPCKKSQQSLFPLLAQTLMSSVRAAWSSQNPLLGHLQCLVRIWLTWTWHSGSIFFIAYRLHQHNVAAHYLKHIIKSSLKIERFQSAGFDNRFYSKLREHKEETRETKSRRESNFWKP